MIISKLFLTNHIFIYKYVSMKIIINEHQESIIETKILSDEIRDRIKKVNDEKMELENFIESHGEYMIDVTNDKTYMVQYLKALSELVGKKYAMCAPVKKDGTYGAFYVKPFETFKKTHKSNFGVGGSNSTPQKIKPNLYQMMGLNK